MQGISSRLRPFIGTKAFYKSALLVMLPVMVQQLINNLFNMVDNIMVGSLDIDGLAMSAVTVANKPYLVFFGVLFGVVGAGGLMLSQYYGAGDRKTCQGLFSLQLVLGLVNAMVFTLLLFFWPEAVMRIFVSDERTIALGVQYLRIVCFSYIPTAISSTCIFSLRSLGRNGISMKVSLLTMAINAGANYVLIFGHLGFPAMGVEGAALGTLVARLCEMTFYLLLLFRKRMFFTTELLAFARLTKGQLVCFVKRAIPLVFNEILWTMGNNVYFWCYARLDEMSLPAITISELCFQIAAVLAMGTSSAVSVLVGAELGANELQKAKDNCKKLLSLDIVIGLCTAALCVALGLVFPYVFAVSASLRSLATRLALIFALFAPLNFIYSFCFFCIRAGGDTRSAMLLDSGYMWLLPVPVSIALALLGQGSVSIFAAVLAVQLLSNAKAIIALRVLRNGRWVRNITLEDEKLPQA